MLIFDNRKLNKFKVMEWSLLKPQIEKQIKEANITNKEAIKCILNFERRVNTCKNMIIKGASWESMCYSEAYRQADLLLTKLNGNGYIADEHKYSMEWSLYCKAYAKFNNGYEMCVDANLGDFLC